MFILAFCDEPRLYFPVDEAPNSHVQQDTVL